ncbi:MAG: neutral/alkaline non-lysosomal ceramidase N-terminal domain-containing protein [Clostridia bacterium]|nr:neutral/alkaline non-lysosomal ceramidase N-terminal domain-containing protein [Clostridia bacterium]
MEKSLFRCGFGKANITPSLGSPLVGYYRLRLAKGVLDHLFVRAILFENGESKGMIMSMDLCLMTKDLCREIRERISEKTGLCPDSILISLSHTHTGPLTNKDFASDTKADPSYLALLKEKATEAAEMALADLKPAKLFYAKTEAKGISFVRRFRMKDGSVKTNPRTLDPEIDHPLGTPNEELRLLKIVRDGGEDLILVNFGTHADTVGGEYISADYPGYVCSTLEGAIPNSRCMFLLGPQGDVNHCNRFALNAGIVGKSKTAEDPMEQTTHARYMGRVIAGQILSVYDRAEEINTGEIRFGTEEIALANNRDCDRIEEALAVQAEYNRCLKEYGQGKNADGMAIKSPNGMSVPEARRIIRMQSAPEYYYDSVFALKVGEFVFAGLPGEPFTEIGRRIYDHSPFEKSVLCCLTNSSCGYIATSRAFEEGATRPLPPATKKAPTMLWWKGCSPF